MISQAERIHHQGPLMMGVRNTVITARQPRNYRTTALSTAAGLVSGITSAAVGMSGSGSFEKAMFIGGTTALGYGAGKAIKHMRARKNIITQTAPDYVVIEMPGSSGLESVQIEPVLGSLKKGGKIKKSGLYRLHKGEKVIPA